MREFWCWLFNQCLEDDHAEHEELEKRVINLQKEVERLTVERLYGIDRDRRT